jgi:hypothetical protein
MHYLSILLFAFVVAFILCSARPQWIKGLVGASTIAGMLLQYRSPYPLLGAAITAVVGVVVAVWWTVDR